MSEIFYRMSLTTKTVRRRGKKRTFKFSAILNVRDEGLSSW